MEGLLHKIMDIYLLFALTVFALVLIPGPNVALIVAMSLVHGTRVGLISVAGTTTGLALQLLAVVFGAYLLIEWAAALFDVVRWVGVCYLIYLGVRMLLVAPSESSSESQVFKRSFSLGVMTAFINPKTLMFNAALLPQFVVTSSGQAVSEQLALLAAIYLIVIALGDSLWVLAARQVQRFISHYQNSIRTISAACFIGAGVLLAFARRV